LCAHRCCARALTLAFCTCTPLALRLGSSSDVLHERTRIPAAETLSRALRRQMSRPRRYLSPALGRVHMSTEQKDLKVNEQPKADTVGYKHPPKEHRFQRGQSGNPAGKPKGARSFKSDLRDELSELMRITEGGQEIEVSKQRLLIKRLVASAIEGDARAIATVVSFCVRAFDQGDGDDVSEASEDRAIIEAFARDHAPRRRKTAAHTPSTPKEQI
jgi:Family of unknown function (DUF5681)